MFSGTSFWYSGSDTSNVNVCGMPMVLPVASLFSKTIVVGPATAVVGAVVYLVMSSPAVQVSVCAAAPAPDGVLSVWPEAEVEASPTTISSAASSAVHSRPVLRLPMSVTLVTAPP